MNVGKAGLGLCVEGAHGARISICGKVELMTSRDLPGKKTFESISAKS